MTTITKALAAKDIRAQLEKVIQGIEKTEKEKADIIASVSEAKASDNPLGKARAQVRLRNEVDAKTTEVRNIIVLLTEEKEQLEAALLKAVEAEEKAKEKAQLESVARDGLARMVALAEEFNELMGKAAEVAEKMNEVEAETGREYRAYLAEKNSPIPPQKTVGALIERTWLDLPRFEGLPDFPANYTSDAFKLKCKRVTLRDFYSVPSHQQIVYRHTGLTK